MFCTLNAQALAMDLVKDRRASRHPFALWPTHSRRSLCSTEISGMSDLTLDRCLVSVGRCGEEAWQGGMTNLEPVVVGVSHDDITIG